MQIVISKENRKEPYTDYPPFVLPDLFSALLLVIDAQQADFCGCVTWALLHSYFPFGFTQWEGPGKYQRAGGWEERKGGRGMESQRESQMEKENVLWLWVHSSTCDHGSVSWPQFPLLRSQQIQRHSPALAPAALGMVMVFRSCCPRVLHGSLFILNPATPL